MTPRIENFINLLAKTSLNYYDFLQSSNDIKELSSRIDVKDLYDWKTLGLNLKRLESNKITLTTRFKNISEQEFCIVDLETSGSIRSGQIIEIGAVKVLDGEIIDKFESLVYADYIPSHITDLTGIHEMDLMDAPNLKEVILKFKLFLRDSVFVAHNVQFDFNYLSATLEKLGYGFLLNRSLCTIDLARKTIPCNKYGLSSLKELLKIDCEHHRAFSDAYAASEIFKESLKRLPTYVQSVEDLIYFSKHAKSVKIVEKFEN